MSPAHAIEPEVSIIIPAYRGFSTIADCLESVLLAASGHRAEVIVVESSGDGTAGLVQNKFPDVTVISLDRQASVGQARNIGAKAARGAFVFFVDQDCTVPEDWIDQLRAELVHDPVGAAGGSIGFRNWSNWSGSAVYFLEFLYHFPSKRAVTRSHPFLLGCNLACRKEVFNRVEFPAQTLAEDVLFCASLRNAGWDIAYKPAVQVRHWNREGWGEFFRYNRMMGLASAGYHQVLGNRSHAVVSRFPWLIFLSPLVMLPRIAGSLIGQWSYLFRFMLLVPVCWIGNWVWGAAFYHAVRKARGESVTVQAATK